MLSCRVYGTGTCHQCCFAHTTFCVPQCRHISLPAHCRVLPRSKLFTTVDGLPVLAVIQPSAVMASRSSVFELHLKLPRTFDDARDTCRCAPRHRPGQQHWLLAAKAVNAVG